MSSLSEHADLINAAIRAAKRDGLVVEFNIERDYFDYGEIRVISLDISDGSSWTTVYKEEWNG